MREDPPDSDRQPIAAIEEPAVQAACLAAALDYAAAGLAVFPCVFGTKEPAVPRGFYSATTNPATIKRWFGGTVNYTSQSAPAWPRKPGCSTLTIAMVALQASVSLSTSMVRCR